MGINDYISNTAGMIGGMLNNYIWNYLVNFKPNSRFLKRFLPYLLIWLFNLGLSNFILFGFNRNLLGITQLTINIAKLPNIGFLASFVEENIFWMAKAIGIAVKVMIGYFLNKKITFQ
jgi:putative flippase GtrA